MRITTNLTSGASRADENGRQNVGSGERGEVAPVLKYGTGMVAANHEAVNPVLGLMWEMRRCAYNILALEQRLAALTGDELVWGTVSEEQRTSLIGLQDYEKSKSAAGINHYVQLYLQERAHYARVAKMAIDSDLDARLVMASTETSEHYYRAIQVGMEHAGLTDEQKRDLMAAASLALQRTVDGLGADQIKERRELEAHRMARRGGVVDGGYN